ncbi:MAG: lysylphosphatidylglycerol synthase transmembrane domain-containing protein [Verrucomicrobia bacterium]|nr:lysylphosphatidylglycerol synthase transmembrane domain-containing protein [Verrucomicrobiota bacterium]
MKKHLGILLRCAVSIGILYFIFKGIFAKESPEHPWTVGAAKLWHDLTSPDPLWLLGGIALFTLIIFVNIERWQIILRVQHIELSFWRAMELFFIGHFFNSFMLGSTGGDVVKAYYAAQETHHKKAEAVMTIVIDRLIGLIGLFAVAAVMMLANLRLLFGNEQLRPMAVSVMSILGVLLLCLFVGFWPGLGKFLHEWRERVFHRGVKRQSWKKLFSEERLDRWSDQFAAIRENVKKMIGAYQAYAAHKPALIKTFLLALVTHVSLIFSAICFGKSLGIEVHLGFYFVMVPAINCIAAVPITINGLGVREGLFVAAFAAGGVRNEKALLLSLLGFAVSLFFSIIGGVVYLFFERTHPSVAQIEAAPEE